MLPRRHEKPGSWTVSASSGARQYSAGVGAVTEGVVCRYRGLLAIVVEHEGEVGVPGSVFVAHVVQPLYLGCVRRREGAGHGQVLEQVVGGAVLDRQAEVLVAAEAVDVEDADLAEPDPDVGGGVTVAGQ